MELVHQFSSITLWLLKGTVVHKRAQNTASGVLCGATRSSLPVNWTNMHSDRKNYTSCSCDRSFTSTLFSHITQGKKKKKNMPLGLEFDKIVQIKILHQAASEAKRSRSSYIRKVREWEVFLDWSGNKLQWLSSTSSYKMLALHFCTPHLVRVQCYPIANIKCLSSFIALNHYHHWFTIVCCCYLII